MTQGYVFVYRPTLGTGMIVTDEGEEVPFLSEDKGAALEGGDVVQLEWAARRRPDAFPRASTVRIVEKGLNRLAGASPNLIHELHSLMEFGLRER